MAGRYVTVTELDGDDPITHASGQDCPSDYETMCGIDGHDDKLGQSVVPTPRGAKINCAQCKQTILAARKYTLKDFAT